jgi:peptide-methionine (S)-S-oxide reductase
VSNETITLGASCFWCAENIFNQITGLLLVTIGYADGDIINPSYKQVWSGITNHAEVVQITFNPSKLAIEQLLTVFLYSRRNNIEPSRW